MANNLTPRSVTAAIAPSAQTFATPEPAALTLAEQLAAAKEALEIEQMQAELREISEKAAIARAENKKAKAQSEARIKTHQEKLIGEAAAELEAIDSEAETLLPKAIAAIKAQSEARLASGIRALDEVTAAAKKAAEMATPQEIRAKKLLAQAQAQHDRGQMELTQIIEGGRAVVKQLQSALPEVTAPVTIDI